MTYLTDAERDQLMRDLQDEVNELRWELHSGAYDGCSEQTRISVSCRIMELEDQMADIMDEDD